MEKGINDESALDKLYDTYMDNDNLNLLYEEFDYILVNLISVSYTHLTLPTTPYV